MPAKNCAQLRAAYAAQAKNEAWGAEMIEKTSEAMKERCGREKRNKKRRFSPQRRGE